MGQALSQAAWSPCWCCSRSDFWGRFSAAPITEVLSYNPWEFFKGGSVLALPYLLILGKPIKSKDPYH